MIEGTLINLEPLEGDFIVKFKDWINTPGWYAVDTRRRFEPQPLKRVEQLITKWEKDERSVTMGIRTRGDDPQPIGLTGWYFGHFHNRVHAAGIIFFIGDERFYASDAAVDAFLVTLRMLFESNNRNRVELRLPDYDEARLAIVRRCGMVEEGRVREAFYADGGVHDLIHFGMLRDEWPGYEALVGRLLKKEA